MLKLLTRLLLFAAMVLMLSKCSNSTSTSAINNATVSSEKSTLPIKGFASPKGITASQFFDINGSNDKVIEGKNGTIIVCPKACFTNAKGQIVSGNIKIELKECLHLDDMILSNLATTSNGKALETDGMIYLAATANGERLQINKKNPIHIEIPTQHKQQGMSAYKGIKDSVGNINWVEPKIIEDYLVTVDLDLLDFLPPNFAAEVDKGMPYRHYKTATPQLVDSLYYSLSVSNGKELLQGLVDTNLNEAYYNKNRKVVNGRYDRQSYNITTYDSSRGGDGASTRNSGIDPAIIKVLKSKQYQNTFIATREFEARLKTIFKACDNRLLQVYVANLNKNLYVLDSIAENLMKGTEHAKAFGDFRLQRKTNVRHADKYYKLLQNFYSEQLSKVKTELQQKKEQVIAELQQKNTAAEKLTDSYTQVLWRREKYRMETYGFDWSDTGWINVDRGIAPKNWGPKPLEFVVQNAKEFEQIYCYVVYSSIKSIYRLNTLDKTTFYVGNSDDRQMLMPKKSVAYAIVLAYKEEQAYFAKAQFETGTNQSLTLLPKQSSDKEISDALDIYNKDYLNENSIALDMQYMRALAKERQRQKVLERESQFIYALWHAAYPCGDGYKEEGIRAAQEPVAPPYNYQFK
ncbi:MAG: hypothetical protein RL660_2489 [Bacteroidota bacterium]|jgi:hypothetical protein